MATVTLKAKDDTLYVEPTSFNDAEKSEWMSFWKENNLKDFAASHKNIVGGVVFSLFPGKGNELAEKITSLSFVKIQCLSSSEVQEATIRSLVGPKRDGGFGRRYDICPYCGHKEGEDHKSNCDLLED